MSHPTTAALPRPPPPPAHRAEEETDDEDSSHEEESRLAGSTPVDTTSSGDEEEEGHDEEGVAAAVTSRRSSSSASSVKLPPPSIAHQLASGIAPPAEPPQTIHAFLQQQQHTDKHEDRADQDESAGVASMPFSTTVATASSFQLAAAASTDPSSSSSSSSPSFHAARAASSSSSSSAFPSPALSASAVFSSGDDEEVDEDDDDRGGLFSNSSELDSSSTSSGEDEQVGVQRIHPANGTGDQTTTKSRSSSSASASSSSSSGSLSLASFARQRFGMQGHSVPPSSSSAHGSSAPTPTILNMSHLRGPGGGLFGSQAMNGASLGVASAADPDASQSEWERDAFGYLYQHQATLMQEERERGAETDSERDEEEERGFFFPGLLEGERRYKARTRSHHPPRPLCALGKDCLLCAHCTCPPIPAGGQVDPEMWMCNACFQIVENQFWYDFLAGSGSIKHTLSMLTNLIGTMLGGMAWTSLCKRVGVNWHLMPLRLAATLEPPVPAMPRHVTLQKGAPQHNQEPPKQDAQPTAAEQAKKQSS